MVSSNSLNSLLSTLVYILGFTLAIEGAGMLAIWSDIHGTMGMDIHEELAFSAFHSISAFCNAGFSTLPGNLGNPLLMSGHNPFYIYISLLIILGGYRFSDIGEFQGYHSLPYTPFLEISAYVGVGRPPFLPPLQSEYAYRADCYLPVAGGRYGRYRSF